MIEQTDIVAEAIVARLAACLDLPAPTLLPPLWHWLFFLDTSSSHELGLDGHRVRGGLVHHDPELPARMWAGGRIQMFAPIAFDTSLRRQSKVASVHKRQGRTGRLQFITIEHKIYMDDALVIDEQQDLVYRGAVLKHAAPPPAAPTAQNAAVSTITPDEVMLFRFSALTFNAHRIHYDRPYATMVEHYPGLVVHGPLQVLLLAEHLRNVVPGAILRRLVYRGQAPAFAGQALRLEAWPDLSQPLLWQLQTRAPSGAVCMTAQAEIVQTRPTLETQP